MTVLWCGGEDVDFPNGAAVSYQTSTNCRYDAYSRVAIETTGGTGKSVAFPGGAVTSCWLHAVIYLTNPGGFSGEKYIGLGKSGTDYSVGIGNNGADGTLVDIFKFDGATKTVLATSASSVFPGVATKFTIDMQVIDYGASATVNVYIGGSSTAAVTYSGDVTVGGNTNVDSVFIYQAGGGHCVKSEIIVSSSDTRSCRLCTLSINAAGSTNAWTGSATDIDELTNSTVDVVFSDTTGAKISMNLTESPVSASFCVGAIKELARALRTDDSTPLSLNLGIISGTVVDINNTAALSTGWVSYERLMVVNPITGDPFSFAETSAIELVFAPSA